jgi:predicted RNA methylase
MMATAPIIADQLEELPPSQALATLENIDDICAGRDRAIDLWIDAHRSYHASMDAIARASIAGGTPALQFTDHRTESGLAEAFAAKGTTKVYEGDGWRRAQVERDAEELLRERVTVLIDRQCWRVMAERLGIDDLLDRQARDEFHQGLAGTPPTFNPENVRATFETVWAGRRDMYLRGVANVFMEMDRRFRSHDGFKIGNRLIFSYAMNEYSHRGLEYRMAQRLNDVERIFRELDGKGPLPHGHWTSDRAIIGRVETDYFKMDGFQNRNVHLWFTRKDLLAEVNKLLLEYYKPVEGDIDENGPSYEEGPLFHSTPAKHYGFFPSPAAVVEQVIERAEWLGAMDPNNDWSRQNWKPLRVLEPSAGTGAIAAAVRERGHKVTCVEIQPHLAAMLRANRFETREADFLKLDPSQFEPFDLVLMNPPFDRGRDCDHVRHAFRFLGPGGRLVAVMSARAEHATDKRHAALHELVAKGRNRWGGGGGRWHDLPERSFAEHGTNVNTVILVLDKEKS